MGIRPSRWFVIAVAAITVAMPGPEPADAQGALALGGRWTLNRSLSQIPEGIGFAADGLPAEAAGTGRGGGSGRARRGSSGGGAVALPMQRESADDAQRLRVMLGEVRSPPTHVTIVETPAAVTIADDRGRARAFHLNGREEVLVLDDVPVGTTARNEADRLLVVYSLEEGRTLRYLYHHTDNPARLVVEVDLLGRGGGDKATLVYEPASATDTLVAAPPASAPPADGGGNARFNQKPDAELKGLTSLGLVVEDLSGGAAACGLTQAGLETAVSKRLTDAGFKVARNSDEDTYVYVHVVTTNPSGSLCVSSYDVIFYSHVTAKLSYQQAPVLLQVSLLNKGGLAGGPPATHGAAVLRGVQDFVDQFAARIHDANR